MKVRSSAFRRSGKAVVKTDISVVRGERLMEWKSMNKKYVLWGVLVLFHWVSFGCDFSDEQMGGFESPTNRIAHSDVDSEGSHLSSPTSFTLWQLASQKKTIMMGYVLKSLEGNLMVVDGGFTHDAEYLRSFLEKHGNHVSAWFISHPHADHIEALTWILSNQGDLKIDAIYASFPPMEWIQEHESGTAKTLADFYAALEQAGRSYIDVEPGNAFDIDEIHIEILATENPEITEGAVNNSSMVMRVSDPKKSVLFLGDTEGPAGAKILENVDHKKLKADYVQASHHGNWGVDAAFYNMVQPEYVLWPTPLWLWNNDKSGGGYDSGPWTTLETRQWMKDLNVKSNYVSGVSGLIKIQ